MRGTRTSRVTRVGRSHLAFAHQGRYLLKGGGSITARPLFMVCPDIYSIEYRVWSMEYSYRAFDNHSWLAMARKDMGWYGILTLAPIPGYGMGSRYEIPYH